MGKKAPCEEGLPPCQEGSRNNLSEQVREDDDDRETMTTPTMMKMIRMMTMT